MKCLIVEDDRVSSQVLEKMMTRYGSFDAVVNGQLAIERFRQAHESASPYDLVLMDIMMPEINGLQSVKAMRQMEVQLGVPLAKLVKVIMTTALDDPRTIMKALYESDASSYLVKPITLQKLTDELRMLKLIP